MHAELLRPPRIGGCVKVSGLVHFRWMAVPASVIRRTPCQQLASLCTMSLLSAVDLQVNIIQSLYVSTRRATADIAIGDGAVVRATEFGGCMFRMAWRMSLVSINNLKPRTRTCSGPSNSKCVDKLLDIANQHDIAIYATSECGYTI